VIIGKTEDFMLRTLELDDLDALRGLTPGDLAMAGGEWICPPGGEAHYITTAIEQLANNQGFRAGIWRGETLAGLISLHKVDRPPSCGGISYAVGAPFRRQGIATAACRAVLDFGFGTMRLNRIQIIADTKNVSSCAVAERVGVIKEGVIRDYWQGPQGFGDVAQYSLLAREWVR
jgi:ribosomal-protein-serine acetyltransferase